MKAINKVHELALRSEDVKIEYDREVMNEVYLFIKRYKIFEQIGESVTRVLHFHEKFCIENGEFPKEKAYDELYPEFIEYVRGLKTPPVTYDDLCDMLRDWKGKHCTETEIEADWQEPPRLSYGSPDNYSDDDLIHYYRLINAMYSPEKIQTLLSLKRTFIRKVYDEITKRGLEKNELRKHRI